MSIELLSFSYLAFSKNIGDHQYEITEITVNENRESCGVTIITMNDERHLIADTDFTRSYPHNTSLKDYLKAIAEVKCAFQSSKGIESLCCRLNFTLNTVTDDVWLLKIELYADVISLCAQSLQNVPKKTSFGVLMRYMSDDWAANASSLSPGDIYTKYCLELKPIKMSIHDIYEYLPIPKYEPLPVDNLFMSSKVNKSRYSILKKIPDEVLSKVFLHLDAYSLFKSSCSCRLFHNLALAIIPGLSLALFPHQFTSVWWIRGNEARRTMSLTNEATSVAVNSNQPMHPSWRSLRSQSGKILAVNLLTGQMLMDNLPYLGDVRGGLLCDEPGLGKTVTILAAILCSYGTVSGSGLCLTEPTNNRSIINSTNESRRLRGTSLKSRLDNTARYLTKATLIVVPDTLLPHWSDQVYTHIRTSSVRWDIFVDTNIHITLPTVEDLSKKSIVITTHSRLSQQWRDHRLSHSDLKAPVLFMDEWMSQSTSQKRSRTSDTSSQYASPNTANHNDERNNISVLLQIRWRRLVVDEGHTMAKGVTNSGTELARIITADHRWLLTGTPLPSASVEKALRQLYEFLRFLRYEPFIGDCGEQIWRQLVSGPIKRGEECGYRLLLQTLSHVMIRHTKEAVTSIPKPVWHMSRLQMSLFEKENYNAVAALAKTNLVVTELDYELKNGRHPDSLLNPNNRQYLQETLANIRIASCGGGKVTMSLPVDAASAAISTDISSSSSGYTGMGASTLLQLKEQNLPESSIDRVYGFMKAVVNGIGWKCDYCRVHLPLLLVTPCGHLHCPDCSERMHDRCGTCDTSFDWNLFQKLQPGFEATDFEFIRMDSTATVSGGGMSPSQTFGSTTSGRQDGSMDDVSTKVRFVLRKIEELNPISNPVTTPTMASRLSYDNNRSQSSEGNIPRFIGFQDKLSPVTTIAFQTHISATSPSSHLQSICHSSNINDNNKIFSPFPLRSTSKSSFVIPNFTSHLLPHGEKPHVKIVIFSQFVEFLRRLKVDLDTTGVKYVTFMGRDKDRGKALQKFRNIHDIQVLLLSRDGALGLDLSFATHLFLMDTLMDRELEDQVVSRVYRMGCRAAVQVFQLVMENTLEESILELRSQEESGHVTRELLTDMKDTVIYTRSQTSKRRRQSSTKKTIIKGEHMGLDDSKNLPRLHWLLVRLRTIK